MTSVTLVETEDDKYAQIIRLLLTHPSFYVNKHDYMCQTTLCIACDMFVQSQFRAQLLLSDKRGDVHSDDNVEIQH